MYFMDIVTDILKGLVILLTGLLIFDTIYDSVEARKKAKKN